jgi:hypothetical protein
VFTGCAVNQKNDIVMTVHDWLAQGCAGVRGFKRGASDSYPEHVKRIMLQHMKKGMLAAMGIRKTVYLLTPPHAKPTFGR